MCVGGGGGGGTTPLIIALGLLSILEVCTDFTRENYVQYYFSLFYIFLL